jgi:hypothetical protein
MKVYCCSKSKHWPFWTALRAAGVPIVASWIDAEFNRTGEEPSHDHWARHWETCCREAAEADVTLLYAGEDERQMGALVEVGSALGAGKRIFLITRHDWSWAHHPRVRRFETLEAAITAIQAGAQGARLWREPGERPAFSPGRRDPAAREPSRCGYRDPRTAIATTHHCTRAPCRQP